MHTGHIFLLFFLFTVYLISHNTLHHQRKYHQQAGQYLGDRNIGMADKKLIRPQTFYDTPSQSISAQIQERNFALELFTLPVQEQQAKNQQIPHTFI